MSVFKLICVSFESFFFLSDDPDSPVHLCEDACSLCLFMICVDMFFYIRHWIVKAQLQKINTDTDLLKITATGLVALSACLFFLFVI